MTDRYPLPVLTGAEPKTCACRTPGCACDEFPRGAFPEDAALVVGDAGLRRRTVLQGLGVAAAATSLGACFQYPEEEILPYSQRPDWVTPGIPLHFATSLKRDGYGRGVIVRSNEGRPTKIEGNPEHPWSQGATSAIDQAELYELFNPDRLRVYRRSAAEVTSRKAVRSALAERAAQLEIDQGAGLGFLLEPDASPLRAALIARIRVRFPKARFFLWTPIPDARVEGGRIAWGHAVSAEPRVEDADVLVSLGSDFLMEGPGQLRHARALAEGRLPDKPMKRLYVAESPLTVTGMFADHRLPAKPAELERVLWAFAEAVSRHGEDPELAALLQAHPAPKVDDRLRAWVELAAKDFAGHPGRAALLVGSALPPALIALAHAVNARVGRAFDVNAAPHLDGFGTVGELVDAVRTRSLNTLVIAANDPVRTSPGDVPLDGLLGQIPHTFYLAFYPDETAARCAWAIPRTHALEEWGDARAPDGTVSFVQPLIQPLFEGLSETRVLATFAMQNGEDLTGYELLRAQYPGPEFDEWIRTGVHPNSPPLPPVGALRMDTIAGALAGAAPASKDALQLLLVTDAKLGDGRYAHNPWLQELPDPVTKLTWGNAAWLSRDTAKQLGIESGNWIRVTAGERALEVPAWIVPGHADGALTLALGYGQKVLVTPSQPGSEGERAQVGLDAFPLLSRGGGAVISGVEVKCLGGDAKLAFTQHADSQHDRELALVRSRSEWRKKEHSDPLEHLRKPGDKLYDPWQYEQAEHRWAMAIDLARCTGCSACVIACQAENNVLSVGPRYVRMGREMHWLRIDRYLEGDPTNPSAVTQPLMCVHCEFAPCEYVCPVNATVHSSEGLNEQIYNRCVGTRYCSNNCPYKVRRFNFHDWRPRSDPLPRIFKNPEVTVRSRGVMEKCTYCVQRIERARIRSRISGKKIGGNEVVTACQQACPTKAIVFGDLNAPDAEVRRLHEDPRAYELLHDLDTRPRTRHLARVKNENPGGEG